MKIRNFAWSTLLYTTLYVNDDREDNDDDDGPFRYYVTRYVEMVHIQAYLEILAR